MLHTKYLQVNVPEIILLTHIVKLIDIAQNEFHKLFRIFPIDLSYL